MDWDDAATHFLHNYDDVLDYYEMVIQCCDTTCDIDYEFLVIKAHREAGLPFDQYRKLYKSHAITGNSKYMYDLALHIPNRYNSQLLLESAYYSVNDRSLEICILDKLITSHFNLGNLQRAERLWKTLISFISDNSSDSQHIINNGLFSSNPNKLSIQQFRTDLKNIVIEESTNETVVPNIVHFIWLTQASYCCIEFSMIHYMAIKLAVLLQQPSRIYIYNDKPPINNEWWDKLCELDSTILSIITITAPRIINSHYIKTPQHLADVMRICILYEYGGIYLDTDLLLLKRIPIETYTQVTMCQESDRKLWNGFIAAPAMSPFMDRWLYEYELKYGTPLVGCWWAGASVETPMRLYRQTPDKVMILNKEIFLPIGLYDDRLYADTLCNPDFLQSSIGIHLWDSVTRRRGLLPENEQYFIDHPTTLFTKLFQSVLKS